MASLKRYPDVNLEYQTRLRTSYMETLLSNSITKLGYETRSSYQFIQLLLIQMLYHFAYILRLVEGGD